MRIRLFAILRERAGSESIEVDLPEGATVGDAFRELAKLPTLSGVLDRLPVQMAVNRDYATMETRLAAHDELALIPPLSGGADSLPSSGASDSSPSSGAADSLPSSGAADSLASSGAADIPPSSGGVDDAVHVRVTEESLSAEALTRAVTRPGAGAIVTFQGMPRDVGRLDYEAYRPMAEERMTTILRECLERHGLQAVAAEHRIGEVELSEPSVIVAASAAHRSEAFDAAREAIDRIKAEAPIWKREVERDGSARWVDQTPSEADAHDRTPGTPR